MAQHPHQDRRLDLHHEQSKELKLRERDVPNPYSSALQSLRVDPGRLAELRQMPLSTRNYVLLFIPRSGSGLLRSYLSPTRKVGRPAEYFNIRDFKSNLEKYPGSTLAEYLELLRRKRKTSNGVFGMKVGPNQLRRINQLADLMSLFEEKPECVYLRRRELLPQAVSLARLWQSRVGHLMTSEPSVSASARNQSLVYDESEIARAIKKIVTREHWIEEYLRAHELDPLRIFYEDVVSDTVGVVKKVARLMRVRIEESDVPKTTQLIKTGTEENRIWTHRFREEQSAFLKHWEANRSAALPRTSQKGD